jgi:hypothetical protein
MEVTGNEYDSARKKKRGYQAMANKRQAKDERGVTVANSSDIFWVDR